MEHKLISEMDNHELLEFMIGFCRRISEDLNEVTTGNLAHKIGNIQSGLIKMAYKIETTMQENDDQQAILNHPHLKKVWEK